MSRTITSLAAAILVFAPCAARADYPYLPPPVPAPVPRQAPPHRPTLVQIFNWLDTDHNGYLTLDEFLAAPWIKNKARAAKFFYWMDTNKDGLVSLPEFIAAYRRYCGPNGYAVRVAYPWAWACWRPWHYGWYWHGGWRHRVPASGWRPGYAAAGQHRVVRVHHSAKHPGPGGHPHAVKHPKHQPQHASRKRRTTRSKAAIMVAAGIMAHTLTIIDGHRRSGILPHPGKRRSRRFYYRNSIPRGCLFAGKIGLLADERLGERDNDRRGCYLVAGLALSARAVDLDLRPRLDQFGIG